MSTGARLVLLAAVLFGTTGTAQALGPAGADPLAVGAVRLLVGAAGLVAVAAFRGGLSDAFGAGAKWLALGMLGVAGYQVTFFGGVRLAGVGVGTLLTIGSAPIFTGVVALLLTGERPVRAWYSATGVALVGLILVADVTGRPDPRGVVLALAAGASYAVFSVGSQRVVAASTPVAAMAAVFGGGAILVAPILLFADLSWLHSVPGYAVALWLGLVTTTAAYVLYGRGLALTPVTTVATLVLAEPIVALLLATALLREPMGVVSMVGAGLVAIGLLILSRSSRHGHPAVEPVP